MERCFFGRFSGFDGEPMTNQLGAGIRRGGDDLNNDESLAVNRWTENCDLGGHVHRIPQLTPQAGAHPERRVESRLELRRGPVRTASCEKG